ncbi:hypothetical protein DNH61_02805 [Paenibacillus sambharensis]|uniref:Uncharacterized protein n=1 Tax=Paenibacillus sambharensis TaxID=1803190 RepID=A0A2W1M026_9BACL|nr:hypothetical protein [Paenibacillus sambharensis]PZD97301.1 hypothetical protein DNH61_02805 [Paenibacillus sambharensis]
MKEQQIKKWEKTRAKGLRKFVLFDGVLGWGIPTAFLYTLIVTFMDRKALVFDGEILERLLIALVLFPIGGILYGIWVWKWTERNYRKAMGE